MKKLEMPRDVKPFILNQEWGRNDPATYSQFGFTRHNGIDVRLGNRAEVRAPFDFVVTQILWQPNGGGHVIGIMSQNQYLHPDGKPANVQVDYMHLKQPSHLKPGDTGTTGDLLCYAGNSGFSTGPHTHIRHKWQRRNGVKWVDVDKNQAQNTFDPMPYYTKDFAEDIYNLKKQVSLLSKLYTLLKLQKGL